MLRIVLFFIIVALGYSQQAHENFYWKEYDDQGYYRIVSHVCARDLNWGTEYDRYCLDVSYVFDWGRNWDYPNVNVVVPEPSTTGMEDPLNFNSLKVSTISAMTNWNHVTGPGYIDFFAYNSSEESANILDFIYNSVAVIPTDSRLFFPIGYNSAAYFRYAVDDFNLSDDDDYMTFIYQNLNYANNNVNGDYQNSVIFLNGTGDIAWFNQYPPPDPSPPEYLPTHDVEAVITHEFGHILGLSHNNINGSLMSENGAARIVDDPVREAIGALYVIDVNSAVIYK